MEKENRALGFNGKVQEAAKILDQYYISARYPDALPSGAPHEFFTLPQAQEALRLTQIIFDQVTSELEFILKSKLIP